MQAIFGLYIIILQTYRKRRTVWRYKRRKQKPVNKKDNDYNGQ